MVYHLGLACICAGAGLLYLPLRWDHDFRRLDPLRLECYLVGHQSQDVIREPIESLFDRNALPCMPNAACRTLQV